mmetsp:Transcript_27856/g.89800  ORF Transcript_27856/g.89800 Transcript_27856/m.89800 type:complete len:645 (-) Transcript_27856:88-2022(-)
MSIARSCSVRTAVAVGEEGEEGAQLAPARLWALAPVLEVGGGPPELLEGAQQVALFEPPVTVPADPGRAMPSIDDAVLKLWVFHPMRPPPEGVGSGSVAPLRPPSPAAAEVDSSPFVELELPDPEDGDPFTRDDGFDVYVDGARFLPDAVTVPRVNVKALTKDFQIVGRETEAVADLDSDAKAQPKFDLRIEYRVEVARPTATLLLRVDSVEEGSSELRVVGYAVLNLFHKPGSRWEQPTTDADGDFRLNEGAFQLPLMQGPPNKRAPLSLSSLDAYHRVPCATVLVRVRRAAKAPDGTVLTTSLVPKAEWRSRGLMVPAPPYGSRAYDSSRARPLPGEQLLYGFHARRRRATVRQAVAPMAQELQVSAPSGDDACRGWLKDRLATRPRALFDYTRVCKYQPAAGFRVAVEGAHNLPRTGYPFVVYCLSPPAPFYQDPKLTEEVEFTTLVDWDSPQKSPRFLGPPHSYKEEAFNPHLLLLLHVHTAALKKTEAVITSVGWTVLPIFVDGAYVANGRWQLPVYAGDPDKSLLEEMQYANAMTVIAGEAEKGRKSRAKAIDGCSVFVRLIDEQLEGCLRMPSGEYDTKYIPRDRIDRYRYDADRVARDSKTLRKLVPKASDEATFQQTMNRAVAQATDITHHVFNE